MLRQGETIFRRDIVLRDAWRRIEEFFDRTVKNGPAMTSK